MKNYYDLFGIAPDADREAIKRAYRQLARQLHPDMRPDDPHAAEQFKQINEAYQTLINVEKRARYDTKLRHEQAAGNDSVATGMATTTRATSVAKADPSVARARVTYQDSHPQQTNNWVRYTFIGLLITLIIIILQGIFVSIVENDASVGRRAPNAQTIAALDAQATREVTVTPSGPATTRDTAPTLDSQMLFNSDMSCRVNLVMLQSTCDEINAIAFIEPVANQRAVMQIDMNGYQRVVLRLHYDDTPDNWTLNVGGSARNDGTDDISDNNNDAQLSIFGRDLLIYSSIENEHEQLARITNLLPETDGSLTLDITHQQIAWHTDTEHEQLTSRYWLNLDKGQTIYIGLNRAIVQPTTRTGSGLTSLTIWLLP